MASINPDHTTLGVILSGLSGFTLSLWLFREKTVFCLGTILFAHISPVKVNLFATLNGLSLAIVDIYVVVMCLLECRHRFVFISLFL